MSKRLPTDAGFIVAPGDNAPNADDPVDAMCVFVSPLRALLLFCRVL